MNKDSKKFIKYVKRIIPIHSKDKREFILLLTQRIKEFSDEYHDKLNELLLKINNDTCDIPLFVKSN